MTRAETGRTHSSVSTEAPQQPITMFGKINEMTSKIGQMKCFPDTLKDLPNCWSLKGQEYKNNKTLYCIVRWRGKDGELGIGWGRRKGNSMVWVITCFASIAGVCTVRQSASASSTAGAAGGGRNRAGHWLCLSRGRNMGTTDPPVLSIKDYIYILCCCFIQRFKDYLNSKGSIDTEDMWESPKNITPSQAG